MIPNQQMVPAFVFDGGSNSMRGEGLNGLCRWPIRIIPSIKDQCGLGAGTSLNNPRLNTDGKRRSLHHIELIGNAIETIAEDRGDGKIDVLAFFTAAVRNAEKSSNAEIRDDALQFHRAAEVAIGFIPKQEASNPNFIPNRKIETISESDEGHFSAGGVIASMPDASGLVADLGGNSLEITYIKNGIVIKTVSFPIGTLSRKNGVDFTFDQRAKFVRDHIRKVSWLWALRDESLAIYLVGGALRAHGRIAMIEEKYPLDILHGFSVNGKTMLEHLKDIKKMTAFDFRRMGDQILQRANTIPTAVPVVQALLRIFENSSVVFSSYGPREGAVFWRLSDVERRLSPLTYAAENYFPKPISQHTPGRLQAWLEPLRITPFNKAWPRDVVVKTACQLSNFMVDSIASGSRPDVAFDTIMGYEFGDLSHKERLMLALTMHTRYGGKNDRNDLGDKKALISHNEVDVALTIGNALHMADRLARGTPILEKTRLEVDSGNLKLRILREFPLTDKDSIKGLLQRVGHGMGRETIITRPKRFDHQPS